MRSRFTPTLMAISFLLLWSGIAMAQATRTISGMVVTAEGAAVANATIQLKAESSNQPLAATSAADGTFALAKAPTTEVVIQVSAEGYLPVEIPLKAGKANAVFAASLSPVPPPPPPPARSVTVVVRDSATGAALANATVSVRGTTVRAQTDADGFAVLDGVAATELVLEVSAADHGPATLTVNATGRSASVGLASTVAAAPAAPAAPATPPASQLTDEELVRLAEEAAEEEAAKSDGGGEIIIVTGSAIERKSVTTTAPLAMISRKDLETAGVATIDKVLQNLPAQSNGINAQTNNGGDGSARIDLRGVGTNRTLTLINGRRMVSGGTGADTSVDINSIPMAVIERIEVLKDGASAVYGSDAIGGVVNIITRTDLNGSEATIYTGSSTRGDGLEYNVSLATGATSKRASVMFAAGYQKREPVFAGDRDFSAYDKQYNYVRREQTNIGSVTVPAGLINTHAIDSNGDGMPDAPVDLCGLEADGTPLQFCRREGSDLVPFSSPADLYNYQPENYLSTPSERYNVFSSGAYKVTDNVRAFFEGSFINRQSDQRLAPEPFGSAAPISAQSLYNPLGVTLLGYNRRLSEFGPRRSLQDIDTFRMVAGLDGQIPESVPGLGDWKWELSFNFGRTSATQINEGNLIVSRLQSALGPSFLDADGVARCGTLGNEIDGCVPLNLLAGADARAISPEMIEYVTFTGVSSGYNRQQTLLASAHGRLLKTPWGGDIALAAGADYRREAGGFTPDPLTATGDTTGNGIEPTDGSYGVKEGFVELSAVPVVGKGFAQWVELNLAARAFDYDTFGGGVTWKAGMLFRTLGGLAIRGTYSTAFRAPSVGELFSGQADSFLPAVDPCDTRPPGSTAPVPLDAEVAQRCLDAGVPVNSAFNTSQQLSRVGGNPELQEETAKVLTAGIVFEPPAVKGLALTLDYFNIDIDQAIQALGPQVILTNCYARGISEYCALIERDPVLGGAIASIDNATKNIGGTSTAGIDFSVVYDHAYRFGRLRHSLEGTYLDSFEIDNTFQVLQAKGNFDFGVFPTLKTNFTTTWSKDALSAGFNVRFISSYDECPDRNCNGLEDEDEMTRDTFTRKVDANVTADVFAGYSLKSKAGVTSLSVGVNNVVDQTPPVIYSGPGGDSDASTYDYMGRFVYARLSQQF
jgi:outer membrane receptor protein involved in Fe transport